MTIFYGDTMTIEDVWVEGCGYNNSAFKALFENWSKLILNRMLGVPFTHKGIGQRWVDNHGCKHPSPPLPTAVKATGAPTRCVALSFCLQTSRRATAASVGREAA